VIRYEHCTGSSPVPDGRVDSPIYIGLCGKIFDGKNVH
jgi:hypothetical protein